MFVREGKADRIVPDLFPSGCGYLGIVRSRVFAMDASENIGFALGFRAWGGCAELIHWIKIFAIVAPTNRDDISDELNINRM